MSCLAKIASGCRKRRLPQFRLHVTETREGTHVPQRMLGGLKFFQEFRRHIVDDRGVVLDDADFSALFKQFRDHEMRLGLPVEQIIVGLQRPQAIDGLGPELPRLARQDDIHRNSSSSLVARRSQRREIYAAAGAGGSLGILSCSSSTSWLIQSWQTRR